MLYKTTTKLLLMDIFLLNCMINHPLLHLLVRRHYFTLTAALFILLSHETF